MYWPRPTGFCLSYMLRYISEIKKKKKISTHTNVTGYKKRNNAHIHLTVLFHRVCADQWSEIIVCDLLISAALVGLGAKERQSRDI